MQFSDASVETLCGFGGEGSFGALATSVY